MVIADLRLLFLEYKLVNLIYPASLTGCSMGAIGYLLRCLPVLPHC